ncbi:MAG TPA: hypothetical protein VLK58_25140 [Conexibacter sp.]|nr:hypothetical protein [Conexibacter sp.]
MKIGSAVPSLRSRWRRPAQIGYVRSCSAAATAAASMTDLQRSRLRWVCRSEAAARSLAENYVGMERV